MNLRFFRVGLYAVLAAVAVLFSVSVRADAEADYQAGYKSYQAQDFVGAMTPLRKAADAGHVGAMVLLGRVLDYAEENEQAAALYRKAAERGDPEGMVLYGVMLSNGDGVKQDVESARKWVLKAADTGYEDAVNMIAVAYLKGELGYTEADETSPEALAWVQKSAKLDFLPSVDALVLAYRQGGVLGVGKDPALAAEYEAQANRLRNIDPSKVKKRKLPRGSVAK
jgi:TPR repeat protein